MKLSRKGAVFGGLTIHTSVGELGSIHLEHGQYAPIRPWGIQHYVEKIVSKLIHVQVLSGANIVLLSRRCRAAERTAGVWGKDFTREALPNFCNYL